MKYPSERVKENKHGMKTEEKIIKKLIPPHFSLFFKQVLKLDESHSLINVGYKQ